MKIPFNLHDAIDGKPVINGDGEDFQFGSYNKNATYAVIGWVNDMPMSYTKDGRMFSYQTDENVDLFMKPEKITQWIYVNQSNGFATKEEGQRYWHKFIPSEGAFIKIEFYEGENLD